MHQDERRSMEYNYSHEMVDPLASNTPSQSCLHYTSNAHVSQCDVSGRVSLEAPQELQWHELLDTLLAMKLKIVTT